MLRSGISWKLNETIIELWHSSYDIKTSTTYSYCDEDNEILNIDAAKNESYLIDGDSCCRKRLPPLSDNEDDEDDDDVDDDEDEEDVNDILDESDGERHEMKQIRKKRRDSGALYEAVACVWHKKHWT